MLRGWKAFISKTRGRIQPFDLLKKGKANFDKSFSGRAHNHLTDTTCFSEP